MAGLLVWGLRMEPPTSSEGPAPKPPRYYLGELRSPAPLSGGGFQTLPYSRNEKRALDCGPVSHFWWRGGNLEPPPSARTRPSGRLALQGGIIPPDRAHSNRFRMSGE